MTKPAPLPSSGGSYIRDPQTGKLTPAGDAPPPAAPEKAPAKGGVKAPAKPDPQPESEEG